MANPRHIRELADLARDLDLVVYRLERPDAAWDPAARAKLRRELERLRDRLSDVLIEMA